MFWHREFFDCPIKGMDVGTYELTCTGSDVSGWVVTLYKRNQMIEHELATTGVRRDFLIAEFRRFVAREIALKGLLGDQ